MNVSVLRKYDLDDARDKDQWTVNYDSRQYCRQSPIRGRTRGNVDQPRDDRVFASSKFPKTQITTSEILPPPPAPSPVFEYSQICAELLPALNLQLLSHAYTVLCARRQSNAIMGVCEPLSRSPSPSLRRWRRHNLCVESMSLTIIPAPKKKQEKMSLGTFLQDDSTMRPAALCDID